MLLQEAMIVFMVQIATRYHVDMSGLYCTEGCVGVHGPSVAGDILMSMIHTATEDPV